MNTAYKVAVTAVILMPCLLVVFGVVEPKPARLLAGLLAVAILLDAIIAVAAVLVGVWLG